MYSTQNADAALLPQIYADTAAQLTPSGKRRFRAFDAEKFDGYVIPGRHLNGYQAGSISCTHQVDTTGMDATKGAGIASESAGVAASGTSLAATQFTWAATALPIVGWIAAGLSLLTFGLGKIFGGHAKAVARENATLCSAAQIFNAALDQVDAAYYSGKMTGDQATAALRNFYQQWLSEYIDPINESCNAACITAGQAFSLVEIRALEDYRQSRAKTLLRSYWKYAIVPAVVIFGFLLIRGSGR